MIRIKNGNMTVLEKEFGDIPDGDYCTAEEFAIINGVKEATVRAWKKRGIVDTITIKGRLYIRRDAQINRKNQKNVF